MKTTFMITMAVAAVSTASAYVCPDAQSVSYSCRQLNVFPLVCYNPKLNKDACNEKQCNQPYIDNYAACQCRRSMTEFFEHSVNVEGLIRRCGGGLNNPFGNSGQYRPGQGTATFPVGTPTHPGNGGPSGTLDPNNPATRIYNGTTYYGGQTGVVSGTTRIVSATAVVGSTTILPGTTTWVSGTPGIIRGTSTPSGPSATGKPATRYYNGTTYYGGQTGGVDLATTSAQPLVTSTESPLPITTQSRRVSPGAIAGIVLGLLAAALIAALLAFCWRRKRAAHVATTTTTHIAHAPPRTIVTEKIEPVVVKAVPADQTHYASSVPIASTSSVPVASTSSTTYSSNTGGYNTQPRN
ncbi:hypothetical protein BGZ83_003665 [Gryganskiella cystojenkinii]|nr:hypothetical protein BGZ83_003665 [Gryganskiella cystojenkinii]